MSIKQMMLSGSLAVMAAAVTMSTPVHAVGVPTLVDPALWGSLPESLARVVYFREESDGATSPAARIYIDGRLHTALLAGAVTVFCVPSGGYALRSLEDPAVAFDPAPGATHVLTGGSTYYFKVSSDQLTHASAGAIPVISNASQAAGVLARGHGQPPLLSRASTVACPSR